MEKQTKNKHGGSQVRHGQWFDWLAFVFCFVSFFFSALIGRDRRCEMKDHGQVGSDAAWQQLLQATPTTTPTSPCGVDAAAAAAAAAPSRNEVSDGREPNFISFVIVVSLHKSKKK